jgi:hypothetical protein
VPIPWTNAATVPSVCSQISRPSAARWPGIENGLLNWSVAYVPGSRASSAARSTMFAMSCAVTLPRSSTAGSSSSSAPSARVSRMRSSLKHSERRSWPGIPWPGRRMPARGRCFRRCTRQRSCPARAGRRARRPRSSRAPCGPSSTRSGCGTRASPRSPHPRAGSAATGRAACCRSRRRSRLAPPGEPTAVP